MIIPWQSLSTAALTGLIEEFVSREGTEYGAREVDLQTKVAQVLAQLDKGEVSIDFDIETQSATILPNTSAPGSEK